RSSKRGTVPAQVEDATAAVRWGRRHAPGLQLDAGRVAVAGSSSGGWNALLAGLTGGQDLDRGQVPPPGREVPDGGHA
ncbi:alpha/beta hydrolase fold domain-containing protein, partial [Micrococcus sp. SIMBA_131]